MSRNIDSSQRVDLQAYGYDCGSKTWVKAANYDGAAGQLPSTIKIISWNVDFMGPMIEERLQCALRHIQHDVLRCADGGRPTPCCVLLQEIHASAVPVILAHPWVRDHFFVTPTSSTEWPASSTYGNVSLVARSLSVVGVSSLVFDNSKMGRNALMVDVQLGVPVDGGAEPGPEAADSESARGAVTLRVANTHLESLRGHGTVVRPVQMGLVAQALKEDGLLGGVVCGDMNAIQDSDVNTPAEVGLCDAWTGGDGDEDGFTWGYQPRRQFPPGRLDKILYTAGRGFTADVPVRVGVGLQAARELWASDHYGLMSTISISYA